ncbi:MAG: DUF6600 domain-containing protein [Steroidobacteraceae bacterium]
MKLRTTLLLLALAAPGLVWCQSVDPPGRLAHLAYVEGRVTFTSAQERAISTLPDRPLAPGDRINTGPGGRAELAFGSATIHLDEESTLAIVELDEQTVRLDLSAGAVSLNLRELLEDETFEIETPNADIALIEPGEYRVDVDADDASVLTVRGGVAEIATAGGPVRIAGDQRARLEGRDAIARLETPRPADEFDEWVLNREVRVADAEPARFTPYEGEEYEELERYGEWYDEPRYGRVWMPAYGYSDWSPYYGGHWQQVGFGWGWYDPAPWGYNTHYNGRWTYLRDRNRWCWVPTRAQPRHHARDTRPFVHPRRHAPERARPDASERTANTRQADEDRIPRIPRGGNREPRPSQPVAAPPPDAGATMPPARTEPARPERTSDKAQNRREYGARPEP